MRRGQGTGRAARAHPQQAPGEPKQGSSSRPSRPAYPEGGRCTVRGASSRSNLRKGCAAVSRRCQLWR